MKYNLTLKHFLKFTTNFLIVLSNQVSVTLNNTPPSLPHPFFTSIVWTLSEHIIPQLADNYKLHCLQAHAYSTMATSEVVRVYFILLLLLPAAASFRV